jgi:hypothetical protein
VYLEQISLSFRSPMQQSSRTSSKSRRSIASPRGDTPPYLKDTRSPARPFLTRYAQTSAWPRLAARTRGVTPPFLRSGASGYFQHLVILEPGLPYINPHYFYPGGQNVDLRHLIGPAKSNSRAKRVSEGIEKVLESLGDTETLPGFMEDRCISPAVHQCLVDTTLKRFD